ncbi:calcium-activated chloride channel regulator 3/4, partial [Mytilus galloprovincialis]
CSLEITGENKKRHSSQNCRLDSTGKPERDCRFFPHRDNRATAKGSIMSHSFVPSVHQFCDSKGDSLSALHNNLAPNLQNFRCGGKSAWDVMRTHLDFKDTTPGLPNKDTSPSFSYIQPNGVDKICLVIDVSGSMSSMIALARNAAISLIKLIIPDGSYVSIVQFSNTAVMLKNLTKITSEKVRDELVDALPTIVRGSTSIGAGLQVALNVRK